MGRRLSGLYCCGGVAPGNLWDFTCSSCRGYPQGDSWPKRFIRWYHLKYGQHPPVDVREIDTHTIDWWNTPKNGPEQLGNHNRTDTLQSDSVIG